MREIVTIEYRGIDDVLELGASMIVESCEAGVLRLRNPSYKPPEAQPTGTVVGSTRARSKGK